MPTINHDLVDIHALSYEALKEHRRQVDERIDELEGEAIRALQEQASAFGFVLAKPGKPNGITYQNPDDPSELWHGKGRKPVWLMALLNQGISLEQLKV